MLDKFTVKAHKGVVTNRKKGTSRIGYWVKLEDIPADVAGELGCNKIVARPGLAWDTVTRAWRDMSNAVSVTTVQANAVLVTLADDGRKGIALLDF